MSEGDLGTVKLIWLDLETTGTDEHDDPILEIGVVVTDAELNELWGGSYVVAPKLRVDELRSRSAEVVQVMHDKNGLWSELNSGITIEDAQADLVERLATTGKKHDYVLCGSGVAHFDRRFITAQMPALDKWFRYYNIDVGILRRAMVLAGREDLLLPKQEKNHRALDDARLHLEEMRYLKASLAKVGA